MEFGLFLCGHISRRVAALVAELHTVPLMSGTACAQFSSSRDVPLVEGDERPGSTRDSGLLPPPAGCGLL